MKMHCLSTTRSILSDFLVEKWGNRAFESSSCQQMGCPHQNGTQLAKLSSGVKQKVKSHGIQYKLYNSVSIILLPQRQRERDAFNKKHIK